MVVLIRDLTINNQFSNPNMGKNEAKFSFLPILGNNLHLNDQLLKSVAANMILDSNSISIP